MTAATQTPGVSFLRRRSTRVVIGAASVAGFTLLGSAPAFAATAADCTVANSVDAGAGGTVANIQTLLDADTAIICLSGTFDVDATLTFDHTLTLFGLSDAVLDGEGTTQILVDTGSTSVEVENITFLRGSTDGSGGAISAYSVSAINSHFEGNSASDNGGAISAYAVFSNGSTFLNNEATFGGAVVAQTVEILDSTFTTNEALFGGAVFAYGTGTVTASTFEGNSAVNAGSAVAIDDLWVENSTFVGNTSTGLGAIVASSGTVLQSTFLDNEGEEGNDVTSWDEDGTIEVRGNIFAGSSTSAHIGYDGGTVNDLGGNLFSTPEEPDLSDVQASTGFGLSSAVLFDGATLADNGGPTETVALYAGSPAVDAVPVGEPSVETDQRGVARDALSDAGAYEFVAALAPEKPALAATGSEVSGWAAAFAGVMLAAGAAVMAATRRRRA